MDRSHYPTRLVRLADEGTDDDVRRLSPSERVAMVWQLTLEAWAFMEGHFDEPRLRRDVVHVARGGR